MEILNFLIVGQGLAGSLLADELLKREQTIRILDPDVSETSSKVAAGIYNPITGRKMVKTWLADQLFPELEIFYQTIERDLGVKVLHPLRVYRPFVDQVEWNDWQARLSDPTYKHYLMNVGDSSRYIPHVSDPHGGIELNCSGYVNQKYLIKSLQSKFINKGVYQHEMFQYGDFQVQDGFVSYKDIKAQRIIFCEGSDVRNNPYLNHLNFKIVKGELLEIAGKIETNNILNRGVFMIPKEDFFTVGSTYDHSDMTWEVTDKARLELIRRLKKWYTGSIRVQAQSAGLRPATFDRRPYVGMLKNNQRIGIFNGLGTKGVSLAPFFAQQFADYLLGKGKLSAEVKLDRNTSV